MYLLKGGKMTTNIWYVSVWKDNNIERVPFLKYKNALRFAEIVTDSVRIWKEVKNG